MCIGVGIIKTTFVWGLGIYLDNQVEAYALLQSLTIANES
jgi:hypothetical protein